MRRALLGLAVLLLACHGEAAAREWSCQLERVVDGDTIIVLCDGEKLRVRLLRIDTPEREEPGYAAAAAALREILQGDPVELDFERPGLPVADDYGRLLAYVRVRGEIANVEMVRLGWSRFWTKYGEGRNARAFRRAEREARDARRGIWAAGAGVESPPASAPSRRDIAASPCRPREDCCRICDRSVACGDACISAESTCHQRRGCACDRNSICASAPR